jgi:hypothetical protein
MVTVAVTWLLQARGWYTACRGTRRAAAAYCALESCVPVPRRNSALLLTIASQLLGSGVGPLLLGVPHAPH